MLLLVRFFVSSISFFLLGTDIDASITRGPPAVIFLQKIYFDIFLLINEYFCRNNPSFTEGETVGGGSREMERVR